MNVLITGGGGFIGKATARALIARGDNVCLLDSLQRRVHPDGTWDADTPLEAKRLAGDVTQEWVWYETLPNADAVLHLAAYQDYLTDYSTFFTVNGAGTAMLYEIANHLKWRGRVVVASSQSVLGEGCYECEPCMYVMNDIERDWDRVRTGDYGIYCLCGNEMRPTWTAEHFVKPITPYGVSKYTEELAALRLGRMLDIHTTALRYSIVQGAGQSPFNAYSGVLRAVALQLLAGRDEVIVFEDGWQQRDFVAIDDVVRANVMALDGEFPHEGINIGGGRRITVNDLAVTMCEIAGRGSVVAPGWVRIGDVRHTLSSLDVACTYGWVPQADYRANWSKYWDWLCAQEIDARRIVDAAFDNMHASGVLVKTR